MSKLIELSSGWMLRRSAIRGVSAVHDHSEVRFSVWIDIGDEIDLSHDFPTKPEAEAFRARVIEAMEE